MTKHTPQSPEDPSRNGIVCLAELDRMEFQPLRWVIPGILPCEGVAMIVASPKVGKSIFVLNHVIAKASEKFNTLYLDLENSYRRAHTRVKHILSEREFPHNVDIAIEWPRFGSGGEEKLHAYLAEHRIDMLVIDTFGQIQAKRSARTTVSYQEDSSDISSIRQLCKRYGVCALLVHHANKSDPTDWMQIVSGTNAIAGGCDTLLYLDRGRYDNVAKLHVAGRDVDENCYEVSYDPEKMTVRISENFDDSELSEERRAILNVLLAADEPMSPHEVADVVHKSDGSVRKLIANMVIDNQVVRSERGKYAPRLKSI